MPEPLWRKYISAAKAKNALAASYFEDGAYSDVAVILRETADLLDKAAAERRKAQDKIAEIQAVVDKSGRAYRGRKRVK